MKAGLLRVCTVLASLALLAPTGAHLAGAQSLAASTASHPGYVSPSGRTIQHGPGASSILVLNTTSIVSSVGRALNDLGYTYTEMDTTTWTGIDFTPYDAVIVTMDGGTMEVADVAALRTGVVGAGKNLIMFGGSCWQSFAQGMYQYLVQIDPSNWCWTVSAPPGLHLLVSNPLTVNLPQDYSWMTAEAGFYMARPIDPAILRVAGNGDHYINYLAKGSLPVHLIWFTNSPYDGYWTVDSDYQVLKQIVANCLSVS